MRQTLKVYVPTRVFVSAFDIGYCKSLVPFEGRQLEQPSLSLNWRIILHCHFLPNEVLSFILDTESLIGIMGNEHISFKSRTLMSGLAGLEPGNV